MGSHQDFAIVIGTVFIDCKGFSSHTYLPTGRNLGRIQFVHGGVGRNVAENLGLMGVRTGLFSSVDTSGLGDEVITRLEASNVETPFMVRAEQNGMGMWLAVLDDQGDLAGSISQMPDLSAMTNGFDQFGLSMIQNASHVLLELDLNAELSTAVLKLAEEYKKPVYGIPGNLDVILQKPELLSKLACFICNHIEAERLLGYAFIDLKHEDRLHAIEELASKLDLQQLVITLGEEGSVYYDKSSLECGHQTVYPVTVVDSSGAGDAFFSGTVMGLIQGLPLSQAVICGTKIAGWTIESPENNCKTLGAKLAADPILGPLLGS